MPHFGPRGVLAYLGRLKKGSVQGAMTTMITWAEGVIAVAEPPIMSVCSVSRVVVESGLTLPLSPCHTRDGLKSLSRKMLGGTGSRLALMRARTSAA